MKQLFINGHGYNATWGSGDRYLSFYPGWDNQIFRQSAVSPNIDASFVVPTDGTISELYLHTDSAIPSDGLFGVTLYKNGSSTTLTAQIQNSGTDANDLTHSISVSAGDTVYLLADGANASFRNNPSRVRWSLKFTGSNANEAIICGAVVSDTDDFTHTNIGNTRSYNHLNSPTTTWATSESDKYFPIPLDGTIKSFYVYVEQAVTPTTLVFSIYKNGSEEASSQITYNNGENGVKSATGLSIDIAPGDKLTISAITTGSGSVVDTISWGIMYSPDIDGESMVGGYTQENLSTTQNTIEYMPLVRSHFLQSSDIESAFIGGKMTLQKFRVLLGTAPGSSQTRVFRIRKNGANANQSITISGTDTTGADSSNIDTFVLSDLVSFATEPTTASAAASRVFWSAVMTIESSIILARPIYFN